MDLALRERVALVTGSSQGIGAATALLLGQEGACVAVTYREQRDKANTVVRQIQRAGGEALAVPLDLASSASIHAAAHAALDQWGRIDILVNNAVYWGSRAPWDTPPFEEEPPEQWRTYLRLNAEGPYTAIQAVLPSMRQRRWGRIVNVSSGIAVDGLPGSAPYAAAKASLHGLTRTLSKELGPDGILVNVIMPGPTLTERITKLLPAQARQQREQASPIRRLLGPEEVAPTIAFLCSPANTAITGEIIRASGGHRS
ncbi:MAG: 3-oxoacyl-[acyl-carrier protein] reductase [Solirubrobacteraceae bacterium]